MKPIYIRETRVVNSAELVLALRRNELQRQRWQGYRSRLTERLADARKSILQHVPKLSLRRKNRPTQS